MVKFLRGPIPLSEFVKGVERGTLDTENSQIRVSPGSTCFGRKFLTHQFTFLEPPILGHKNEFTNHQFETSVLDPPMFSDPQTLKPPNSGKPRDPRLKIYEGSITVSEFVKDSDRDKLDVESIRRGVNPGSTCLSVTKVPPNCDVHSCSVYVTCI